MESEAVVTNHLSSSLTSSNLDAYFCLQGELSTRGHVVPQGISGHVWYL